MRTLADAASMFVALSLQLFVENVRAENIGKARDCVPDQSDSFQKCFFLKRE